MKSRSSSKPEGASPTYVIQRFQEVEFMAAAIDDVPISVQYSRMYASGGQIESLITTIAYPVA